MFKKILIFLIVLVVVIFGSDFLLKKTGIIPTTQNTQQPSNNTQNYNNSTDYNDQTNTPVDSSQTLTPKKHEVIYTDFGYSASEITIKVGDTVVFQNRSSSGMWTASAMHPSHMVYSGTSLQDHCPDNVNNAFDQCKSAQPGESWEFTFTKAGEWGYHNHVKTNHFGKIIVE